MHHQWFGRPNRALAAVSIAVAMLTVTVVAPLAAVGSAGGPAGAVGEPPEPTASLVLAGYGDGPVPTSFDTGQPAALVSSPNDPGAAFVMRAGRLTYDPTLPGVAAAYFSTPDLGAPVTGIGARWSLDTRGAASGAIALVVSRATRDTLPLLVEPVTVHLAVEAGGWELSVQPESSGVLQPISSGGFDPPLAQDGTPYDTSVTVDGDAVTIGLPDGTQRQIVDPRVRSDVSNVATFELYANDGSTDSVPAFDHLWATT